MGKMKTKSIKKSITITFLITIAIICLLSGITIFWANHTQQEILKKRHMIIRNTKYQVDEGVNGYLIDIGENDVEWQQLSTRQNVIYYGCYFAIIILPIVYTILGIGTAAAVYYRKKLREPILQLQEGMERIQANDLDFKLEYDKNDELGQLCRSMEKMRRELRRNNKALWEALEQRKILNASVAHDLRTPITVIRGYLDYLEKNIPQDKLTEELIMDTLSSMQGAVSRLERYVDCVRDIEKIESMESKRESQEVEALLNEMESNAHHLIKDKELVFTRDVLASTINIDKYLLFRVVENLLQNALRYAENKIEVAVSQKENFLIIAVKDDGSGFSETDLEQATTMFYGNAKDNEHFGIGLSISKLLCQKQGGCLYIKNNENAGACATAYLQII